MSDYFAALDLGTNSVVMLLAEAAVAGQLQEVAEFFRVTRLGAGVADSAVLQPSAITAAVDAAADFLAAAREVTGKQQVIGVAVATSAVRDARNRQDFLMSCRQLLGQVPHIFAGDEEARTTFLGATADLPPGNLVVTVDVGGGSTEIGVGTAGDCRLAVSLDLGCVRLGEAFRLYETPTAADQEAARLHVRQALTPVAVQILELAGNNGKLEIVASGGTATSYATYVQQLRNFQRDRVNGYRTTRQQLATAFNRLIVLPSAERDQQPGIEAGRGAVLPGGLLILDALLELLDCDRLQVTSRGLRFGLCRRLQMGELASTWEWPGH